ncbi:hypothetical protein IV01_18135 [Pseudomonas syringae]|uniref:Uncharacterized protein n=1 Tax=Pseudomonas syringae TaxID=317 RepID=A0A085VEM9_PSESX|nr:hypothetical protein IV01_18135 [Pseudomonas syringae]
MVDLVLLPQLVTVGAHEQREAALAVCQAWPHRCLALLVSSYRDCFQIMLPMLRSRVVHMYRRLNPAHKKDLPKEAFFSASWMTRLD